MITIYTSAFAVLDREGNVDLDPQVYSGDDLKALLALSIPYAKAFGKKLYKVFIYQGTVKVGSYRKHELEEMEKGQALTTDAYPNLKLQAQN